MTPDPDDLPPADGEHELAAWLASYRAALRAGTDPAAARRFAREAESVARLRHHPGLGLCRRRFRVGGALVVQVLRVLRDLLVRPLLDVAVEVVAAAEQPLGDGVDRRLAFAPAGSGATRTFRTAPFDPASSSLLGSCTTSRGSAAVSPGQAEEPAPGRPRPRTVTCGPPPNPGSGRGRVVPTH